MSEAEVNCVVRLSFKDDFPKTRLRLTDSVMEGR